MGNDNNGEAMIHECLCSNEAELLLKRMERLRLCGVSRGGHAAPALG